jgi:hypothetical protein
MHQEILVGIIQTVGHAHDIGTAPYLIVRETTEAVMDDRADDSDEFLTLNTHMGAQAVIPPKAYNIQQSDYDEKMCANRNQVEYLFNPAKHSTIG